MSPGNLIAGQPFKAGLRALLVVLLIYALASVVLVRAIENTLGAELRAQTQAEILLLSEIYEKEGADGLVDALHAMDRAVRPPERIAGLLDKDGISLTGPISILPDFVGASRREVTTMTKGRIGGEYFLNAHRLDTMTLVVGRSGQLISQASKRLWIGLTIFGLIMSVAILTLSLWASRTSHRRLEDMEHALSKVSQGEIDTRLPVMARNDQFDRVSVRMNQNLDRLSRLMNGMKTTASAIAHDLKTPLSHTQIALHEAADAVEGGQDPMPKIEAALGEVQALNTVFDSMLRITRIQANTDQSRFEQVDLCDVAEKVVEFMRPLAEEHDQTLHLEAAESLVLADAPMVQQALVNLVKNASVHAGDGASIIVALQNSSTGTVLSVQDNGPGIPGDDMEKVLKPFVRLDGARSTPGSGLGLALVRAVAEHHHADLQLSDAHPGLKVELEFPKFKKN